MLSLHKKQALGNSSDHEFQSNKWVPLSSWLLWSRKRESTAFSWSRFDHIIVFANLVVSSWGQRLGGRPTAWLKQSNTLPFNTLVSNYSLPGPLLDIWASSANETKMLTYIWCHLHCMIRKVPKRAMINYKMKEVQ